MGFCCKCRCFGKKRKAGRKSTYNSSNQSEVQRALRELVETEEEFGEDMKCLVENYLEPMRKELFFDNTSLILFNSVTHDLVDVQRKFQKRLDSHTENIGDSARDVSDMVYDIGDDFLTMEKEFDIFSKYVVVMQRVQKVLGDKENNAKILTLLEKCMESIKNQTGETGSGQKNLTLESIILKPFQRPLKYPLILERLGKQTEEGTIDRQQMEEALESVKRVAIKMNDALKKDEETGEQYKALLKQYDIQEYKK